MAEIEVNNYQSVSCDKTEILLEVLTDMLLIAKVPRVHVYVQNTERDQINDGMCASASTLPM